VVVIHKRLADILEHHGREFRDVRDDLHVASLAGKDAVLATFSHKSGKMEPTPLYDALLEMAGDIKPVVTGIAASADVFAGDEIDRSQVRQFIALLTRIAMTAGGSPPNSPGQRRYYRQNSSSAPTVKQATSTIPIVFVLGNDPLGSGLVANLARPGGNVTGLSIQQTDIAGKRLQLLSEVVPRLRRSERFGQSFIVDNRPGAGSNIGTEIVVRAPANGYTLLLMTASNAINATVYDNLNFDLIRDVAPVASVGVVPFLMVVNPSFPAQTISEFIAYAKAHPAKINMGSAGYGSAPHVFGELFKMMTGIDLVHNPSRDSYWPDLVAGQTQILFAPVISATGYVQSGQLRALAVTTRTRLEAMPAIPALDEFVPGYEASGWLGVGAPKNTPVEIIDKLNNEINAALPDAKARPKRDAKLRMVVTLREAFARSPK